MSLAHVGRPSVLARWARQDGHEAIVACGPACQEVVRSQGLEPLPLLTIDPALFFERIARVEFMYTAEELESYIAAERALLRSVQPDLVVSDFRLSAAITCALTGTRHLALANAYWSPGQRCRFLPPGGGPFRWWPVWVRRAVMTGLRPLALRYLWGRSVNQVRHRFGLPRLADFRLHYTAGDGCAYLDLPQFVPLPRLPKSHFFLGPVVWQPLETTPVGDLGLQRPLVYVALSGRLAGGLLPEVLRGLLALDCDLVLSGVRPEEALRLRTRLPALGNRWLAREMVGPDEILSRAAATVCHGGSGTVYQSLAAGVPVLCLPTNGDQGLVADHAVALGVGVRLEPEHATPGRLEKAIRLLLNNGPRTRQAGKFREWLRRHDTRQRWLDFLAGLAARGVVRAPCVVGVAG